MKQYFFERSDRADLFFAMQDGRITDFYGEVRGDIRTGDLYLARVERIQPSIEAAFVDLGDKKKAFLPLKGQEEFRIFNRTYEGRLRCGDLVLVRIETTAQKEKLPKVNACAELAGRYAVLSLKEKALHFSQKIGEKRKEELRALPIDSPYRVLLRTEASDAEDVAILSEIVELSAKMDRVLLRCEHSVGTGKICGEKGIAERLISILRRESGSCLITRNEEIYNEMIKEIKIREVKTREVKTQEVKTQEVFDSRKEEIGLLERIFLHEDEKAGVPYTVRFHLERAFSEILKERIYLSSGGTLYISETEALTVIDVNTGKAAIGKNREETFLKQNLEAAKEVAFQIRSRNLSGIIIVDFINMKFTENETILIKQVKQSLGEMTPPAVLEDITKLGLVEITRKKTGPSILTFRDDINKTILL